MGNQNTKKKSNRKSKNNKKKTDNESVSDYHCYSCDIYSEQHIQTENENENNNNNNNLTSEQKIEHTSIFKELLKATTNTQSPPPKLQRSNANSILNSHSISILNQIMACASIISETYSNVIGLDVLLSNRLEKDIGQLTYSIEKQAFDSVETEPNGDYIERVYRRYIRYKDKENEESEANRYRNYLMNDTIATRNESTIKGNGKGQGQGRVNVIMLNNNKGDSMKPNNSNRNNISDDKGNSDRNLPNNQIYNTALNKENTIKTKDNIINDTSPKLSPRIKVTITDINANKANAQPITNNTAKNKNKELNEKSSKPIKQSRIKVIDMKPQAKGGGRVQSNNNTFNSKIKAKGVQNSNNTSKEKTLKSSKLQPNTLPNTKQSPKSPSNKVTKHIYQPNIKEGKYSKSPQPLLKQLNNNKRIRVKNLNININSVNVINTIKPIESHEEDNQHIPKSNEPLLRSKQAIPNFKINLAQIVNETSSDLKYNVTNNSNSNNNSHGNSITNEKEKYSINSQDSNPRDIRRLDTPQFHQHKKSQSSKHLYEFNPNTTHTNTVDQPLTGEKFSFSHVNNSLKG